MKTFKRGAVMLLIEEAVSQLKFAENNSGEQIVIHMDEGKMFWVVRDDETTYLDRYGIAEFQYLRPDYNTKQCVLDDADFKGTIAEWEWTTFIIGSDFSDFCEAIFMQIVDFSAICDEYCIEGYEY